MINWICQSNKYIVYFLLVLFIIGLIATIFAYFYGEWNDQQYFKTLDKLTCEQIWQMHNTWDWDTTDYYGDRCN